MKFYFLLFAFIISLPFGNSQTKGRGDIYFNNLVELQGYNPELSDGYESAITTDNGQRWQWDRVNDIWVLFEDTTLTELDIENFGFNKNPIQWGENAGNIFNLNTGNVGVGTIQPAASLHISKNITGATPHGTTDDFLIEGNANTGMSILNNGNGSTLINFGSNTDNVQGTLGFNQSENLMTLGTNAVGADLSLLTGNGSEAARILDNGNVGIGLDSPEYKLDVAGGTRLGKGNAGLLLNTYTGELAGIPTAGTDGGFQIMSPLLSKTVWDIRANDPRDGIYFRVPTALSTTPTADKAALTIQATGRIGVGKGAIEPASVLHIEDDNPQIALINELGTVGQQGFRIANNSDVLAFQRASDTGAFEANLMSIQQSTGNVSIGSSISPSAKLDVQGQIKMQELDEPAPTKVVVTNSDGLLKTTDLANVQGSSSLWTEEVGGDITRSSDVNVAGRLLLPPSDGAIEDSVIKIGQARTGNGLSFIDLIGDPTYTNYGLRLIRKGTGANTGSEMLHRGTGDLRLRAVEAANLELWTSNILRMTVDPIGNVGVGTANPQYLFDVNGDTRISGDALITGDVTLSQGGGLVSIGTGNINNIPFAPNVALSVDGAISMSNSIEDTTLPNGSIQYSRSAEQLYATVNGENVPVAREFLSATVLDIGSDIVLGNSTANSDGCVAIPFALDGWVVARATTTVMNPSVGYSYALQIQDVNNSSISFSGGTISAGVTNHTSTFNGGTIGNFQVSRGQCYRVITNSSASGTTTAQGISLSLELVPSY